MIYFGPCGLEHPAAQGLQRVDGKRQDHQAREYRPQMPFPVAEGAAEMYARPAFQSLEDMVFDMPATATNATDGQGGPPSLKAVARQRQATHERPSRDLGMTLRIFFPGVALRYTPCSIGTSTAPGPAAPGGRIPRPALGPAPRSKHR